VDDAILFVIVNLYGRAASLAKRSCPKAMADISGPVIAIALVLAAVFVPAGFLLALSESCISSLLSQ